MSLVVLAGLRHQWPSGVDLEESLPGSLAAALGLLAGILFSLSIAILDKTIDMDLAGVSPGASTERAAKRLLALAANTLVASAAAGTATALVVLGALLPRVTEVMSALAVALMVLVGTNTALIAGRVFNEAKWRTDRAISGESQRDRDASPPISTADLLDGE